MNAPRLFVLVGASILAAAAPAGAAEVHKIAGGLDNPRHLAFGDKALFVAESGRGGDGPCFPGEEGGTSCVGASGAVTVIDRHGHQYRLVSDLASLADQGTGGNTLLKARRDGSIEVLSVFGNRNVPAPSGSGEIPMQAVPTGVVRGPDGDYYMSQLTGFPFPVGAANVYRVDGRTGNAEVFADGFTNIMDLAFDRDGTLWVLEIDHDSLLGGATDGAIYSVDENGDKQQLDLPAGTLTAPGGITVGDDGALYVTNKTMSAGDGEVLRIDPGSSDDHGDSHGDER
jgi:hypothetical protein